MRGDRAFKGATVGVLALLTLFFVGLMACLLTYIDGRTFFTALISKEILFAVRLSLITATVSTLLSITVAVPAAYALSHARFPGKDIVDTILDLPIVVSPIALGAALLIFFTTAAGATIEQAATRFVFEVPGIILAQFTVVVALAVRLLKSTFDGIDPRYEQVSRTLGLTKFTAFRRVVLPLARNGIIASAILTWARAMGEFGATVTLAGAMKMKTETLPIAIFLNLSQANVEQAVAVILILIILALAALITLRKLTGSRSST
jgi:molybdate transport system permease protein